MNKFALIIIALIIIIGGFWLYQKNNMNNSNTLTLNFYDGGSITGKSFKVDIIDGNITYQEFSPSQTVPDKKTERSLNPDELSEIIKVVSDSGLMSLQSQDFTKDPSVPDQGRYNVGLTLYGQSNQILCAIAPPQSNDPKTKECQDKLDRLRDTFNKVLGTSIY